ncbi:bifunctional 2',3'-cyclic-nucleotide 2'-phosphodiesterase/3'-nucleotidase [Brevibacillus laterosporus]|uniref:bifunctional 2',3'-cyclic-nucleotide 2'-phosphodiesterase/3'-nucleotidase n=1 Tax=Brevibacillus laterosporus TaxID=1465 RepID=UPI00264ED741|nr:bifunctional 2',3'-cyclic-nucleotide 2'-phosphodiesterase/3'-nucleotidase [Brevibacillus laterosporus]MDN9010793.1 bifunctional 2',3'-cyclic-nucleotide 2'-phosphodiesterase/3'-nucleotidase [Brevibacillus laterosporus]MDO0941816.1 bifunctional 2',3'-cyclic-nucleotide 2'-phosphodiesterase/3'-nucleotidase [Brevibacillus laterosporus]
MKKTHLHSVLATSMVLSMFALPTAHVGAEGESIVKLRLMETTDIHTNVVNYDYYKDAPTDQFGLAKTATLIKKARGEVTNSVLFDNGDLIQGNPLGDFIHEKGLKDGDVHPIYKAMNLLDYEVGNIGNHEFNFGLDYLQASLKGAKFPYVNANIYIDDKDNNPDNDKNYFTPYHIFEKKVKDESGKEVTIKIGAIGFAPPQVTAWDKGHLEGKVIAKDIIETAKKFVPQMKKEGADIIVAIPHSGFEKAPAKGNDENAVYYLSKVEGIDAILFGHAHKLFPSKDFDGIEGVDTAKGTINGIPSVMPGFWGDHLGVIDLTLKQVDGKWQVIDSTTEARPIYDAATKKALVEADKDIVNAVKDDHENTLGYVRGPVGETKAPINSFFALVNDDPSVQIVSNAQRWWAEKATQGTEYEGTPILSAAAPFKAGGRNGAEYYTDIKAGTIAVKNVSDLYIYPNTIKAVLIDGSQVKEWLERSAGQFNQIDPTKKEEQALVNDAFPTYNFDTLDGVEYQFDLTQPSRYDIKGTLVNEKANRVINLQYNGKPIDPKQKFIVVTNNYRAFGGGNFPGIDGSNVIIDSPDENREVLINYIKEQKSFNPTADGNWGFAPIKGDIKVTLTSSPKAKEVAEKLGYIKYIGEGENGFAKYSIDLSSTTQKVAESADASKEDVKKEEPKNDDASKEDVKKEEPKKDDASKEDVKKEEPKNDDASKEDVKKEEPKKDDASKEDVKKEEPKKDDASKEDVKKEEPKKDDASKEDVKKEEPKKDPNKLVAVRATAEGLGIQVAYDNKTRSVTLTKGNAKLVYVLGASEVIANGKTLETNSDIVKNRLFLPVGLLEETFGVTIK